MRQKRYQYCYFLDKLSQESTECDDFCCTSAWEILSSEDGKIIHFILELSLLYQEKMETIGYSDFSSIYSNNCLR